MKKPHTQFAERDRFGNGLDAFGNHRDVQSLAESDDRAGNLVAHRVGVDRAGQGHVDFQHVGLKVCQHVESRMPGAEIVDCRDHAVSFVLGKDRLQVTNVAGWLILGHLEHQVMHRKTNLLGCLEGFLQTGGRLIDRVG